MAYAQISDFALVGLLPQAYGNLTTDQLNAALQVASDTLDSYFRGRYGDGGTPLLATWDTQVVRNVCKMAAYEVLGMRGTDPNRPRPFEVENAQAIQWCKDVEHSQAHPLVTINGGPLVGSTQPIVTSYSITQVATGHRGPLRGW